MPKYMEALWGYFDGYDESRKAIYSPYPRSKGYIQGKYRPLFGKIRLYKSKKIPKGKMWIRKGYIRVPATRENIRKHLEWNLGGSEGYQRYAIRKAKRMGMKLSRMKVIR